MLAALNSHYDIVKYLVELGSIIDFTSAKQYNMYLSKSEEAESYEHHSSALLMSTRRKGVKQERQVKTVQYLLLKGADINIVYKKMNVFMEASSKNLSEGESSVNKIDAYF